MSVTLFGRRLRELLDDVDARGSDTERAIAADIRELVDRRLAASARLADESPLRPLPSIGEPPLSFPVEPPLSFYDPPVADEPSLGRFRHRTKFIFR